MANLFGDIDNPLKTLNPGGYDNVNTGLPSFITNIVTFVMIGAGLYAFFNLMFAGFTYITSAGDQKKLEAAVSSINMSLMGLVVMVAAAAITSIVSYLLFGSATAILSPKITGPGSF
ncbi:MAG: hypothetical protein V1487_04600 [bacterium]